MGLQRFLFAFILVACLLKQPSILSFDGDKQKMTEAESLLRQEATSTLEQFRKLEESRYYAETRQQLLNQNNFTQEEAQAFAESLVEKSGVNQIVRAYEESGKKLSDHMQKSNDAMIESRIKLQEELCMGNSERLLSYAKAQKMSNSHLAFIISAQTEDLDSALKECKLLGRCCDDSRLIQNHNELLQKIKDYFASRQ